MFAVLDIMQSLGYRNDNRRERFVAICRDRDVQQLTFHGYMNKQLVKAEPLAHVRIFDVARREVAFASHVPTPHVTPHVTSHVAPRDRRSSMILSPEQFT